MAFRRRRLPGVPQQVGAPRLYEKRLGVGFGPQTGSMQARMGQMGPQVPNMGNKRFPSATRPQPRANPAIQNFAQTGAARRPPAAVQSFAQGPTHPPAAIQNFAQTGGTAPAQASYQAPPSFQPGPAPQPISTGNPPATGLIGGFQMPGWNLPQLPAPNLAAAGLTPDAQFLAAGNIANSQYGATTSALAPAYNNLTNMFNLGLGRLGTNEAEAIRGVDETSNDRGLYGSGIRTTNRAKTNLDYDRQRQDQVYDFMGKYQDLMNTATQAGSAYDQSMSQAVADLTDRMDLSAYAPLTPDKPKKPKKKKKK